MKKMNVALIGCQFMGKAHSSAWARTARFFDTAFEPVLKVACDNRPEHLSQFAARWGWESTESDWRVAVARKDVDIVDICVPTYLHHEVAIAAAQAGKHLFCEKPLAVSCEASQRMLEAARQAGIIHYLNHNYRRCPAVALARQFIDEGRLGRIFHWRGAYLQSWIIDPAFPLTWHLKKEMAGAGPHFDLNSHSVDLARFLIGEISSVTAMTKQFIQERPLDAGEGGGTFGAVSTGVEKGAVTVEDAAFMLAEFENGALGSFESSRFALGRKNYNCFEIYGSRGSLAFNLERMNELQYYAAEDDPHAQGFRTILATEAIHPYVGNWWPPGHIIGYEHTFVHAMADFLNAIASGGSIRPNFEDGVKNLEILEAGLESASKGYRVNLGRKE
jgi:predicted dehydrogenase